MFIRFHLLFLMKIALWTVLRNYSEAVMIDNVIFILWRETVTSMFGWRHRVCMYIKITLESQLTSSVYMFIFRLSFLSNFWRFTIKKTPLSKEIECYLPWLEFSTAFICDPPEGARAATDPSDNRIEFCFYQGPNLLLLSFTQ